MKNRLQALWDQVSPEGGPCPQPDAKAVRRRVDAALDKQPRAAHPWRAVRLAAACAAALVLLTGTALAAGVLPLPDFNALSIFYSKGDNAPGAEGLVDTQPVTVSNDLFTITLTSSLSDENIVYLTAAVQPKTPWTKSYLSQKNVCADSFRLELLSEAECVSPAQTHFTPYDNETQCSGVEIITSTTADRRYAIHVFDPMGGPCKEGTCPGGDCRVEFTVKPAVTHTLEIDAGGTAVYKPLNDVLHHSIHRPETLSVHFQQAQISPLSLRVLFQADYDNGFGYVPLVRFLWKDGTVSTIEDMEMRPISGGSDGTKGGRHSYEQLYVFSSVQDLLQLEALAFEGTAYPLDGGAPYPVDANSLPRRQT